MRIVFGASCIALVLGTGRVQAAPTVTIVSPKANAVVQNEVTTTCTISSVYSIKDVVLQAGSAVATGTTCGKLDTSSLSYGPYTLSATATDVLGGVGTASVGIIVDRPPTLTATLPAEGSIVPTLLPYDTKCTDDGPSGCASFQVSVGGSVVASGTSALSGVLSLGAYTGGTAYVSISATDSRGQWSGVSRSFFVDGSAPPLLDGTVGVTSVPGVIIDTDGVNILYTNTTSTSAWIRTIATKADVAIYSGTSKVVQGRLVAGKYAALSTEDGKAWEWNGTTLTWRGSSPGGTNAFAAGGTRILYRASPSPAAELVIRDPATGAVVFTYDAPNINLVAGAPNDDFAWYEYTTGWSQFHRWHAGTATAVSESPPSGTVGGATRLLTDGVNIGYEVSTSPANAAKLLGISGVVGSLDTASVNLQMANGWTAVNNAASHYAPIEVFRRSPAGARERVSVFTVDCSVEAINPSGDVIYTTGGLTGPRKRFLARDGVSLPREIQELGRPVFVAGAWHLILSGNLYRIADGTPGDAGASDAGTDSGSADAGVDSTVIDSTVDTSVTDTSVTDTSVTDTSVTDTSVTDTSVTDTSVTDTLVVDTSVFDSGFDTVESDAVPPIDATSEDAAKGAAEIEEGSGCTTTTGRGGTGAAIFTLGVLGAFRRPWRRRRQDQGAW